MSMAGRRGTCDRRQQRACPLGIHAACACHFFKDGTADGPRGQCARKGQRPQQFSNYSSQPWPTFTLFRRFRWYPRPTRAMTMPTALSHVASPWSWPASSSRQGNVMFKSSSVTCDIPAVHDSSINRKEGAILLQGRREGRWKPTCPQTSSPKENDAKQTFIYKQTFVFIFCGSY